MGYLDSTSITVDAVLTKKGREILKDGRSLNISSFTVSDTGVDYTLWNPSHPSGSTYYGEAIENLPMLEAGIHAAYSLRNRLMTFSKNTVAMPAIEISGLTSTNTLTFADGDTNGLPLTFTIKGYSSPGGRNTSGLYLVIQNPNVVHTNANATQQLSGTAGVFILEAEIPNAVQYNVPGSGPDWTVSFTPDTSLIKAGRQTNVYVVHPETGVYNSFTVVNNITRLTRNVLTNATKG